MANQWGWITAAVLVAALAGGCGGNKPKDDGGPPPTTDGGMTDGTDGGMTPAPAAGGSIDVKAVWMGEGDARKVSVMLGDAEVTMIDPKAPMDPAAGPDQKLVDALKMKRDEAIAAGSTAPRCVVMCATDMAFADVGKHIMRAAFKAGFKPGAEVEYKPGS
jgi:hypothetical protein